MLNRWTIPFAILCVLFIPFAALAQEQSDSHIIRVTKEIDVMELSENVDQLSASVGDLTKTVTELNGTVTKLNDTVTELNKAYAKIDERTSIILTLLCVILGAIILPPLGRWAWSKLPIRDNKSNVITTQVVQENVSGTTPAQTSVMSRNEETPAKFQQENFPSDSELEEYLKSEVHAAKRKV